MVKVTIESDGGDGYSVTHSSEALSDALWKAMRATDEIDSFDLAEIILLFLDDRKRHEEIWPGHNRALAALGRAADKIRDGWLDLARAEEEEVHDSGERNGKQ